MKLRYFMPFLSTLVAPSPTFLVALTFLAGLGGKNRLVCALSVRSLPFGVFLHETLKIIKSYIILGEISLLLQGRNKKGTGFPGTPFLSYRPALIPSFSPSFERGRELLLLTD